MLQIERQEKIIDYVNEHKIVTIPELCEEFKVSKPTILRDLTKLDQNGLLKKTHGGAVALKRSTRYEPSFDNKTKHNVKKKRAIAIEAAKHIFNGETILLDSGSTSLAIAEELNPKLHITVVTNDIKIAEAICKYERIELILLGGTRRKGVYSLIGPIAESILDGMKLDKVFLGADAIDFENGIMNSNIEESSLKKKMIESAKEVVLVADSSKYDSCAFIKIEDLSKMNLIIVDDELNQEQLSFMKENFQEVIVVKVKN